MNSKTEKMWVIAAFCLMAAAVFVTALAPINSADFWWHLKTGDYILSHSALPQDDPFTYTYGREPVGSEHRAFFMKQYWLAQALFSVVVKYFGFTGLIVFRGLVFVAIAAIVFSLVRLLSENGLSSLALLPFMLATRTAIEDSDRPQMFAFLCAILIIAAVEWAVHKRKQWPLFLINIPAMLLTANMHGGYVICIFILAVYALFSFFEERLIPMRKAIVLSNVLAIVVTACNPNGWYAFQEVFLVASFGANNNIIMEYRSPVDMLQAVSGNAGWVSYFILACFAVVAAGYHAYKRRYSWAALLFSMTAASLYAMRFIYFFVPVAAVLIAVFLGETVFRRMSLKWAAPVVGVLMVCVVLFKPVHPNRFGIEVIFDGKTFPFSAADFILRENIPQPMLNDIRFGGYLAWRLWPRYRMFIDTRNLSGSLLSEYLEMMLFTDTGRKLLDSYKIASVVTPAIFPYTGEVVPLVRGLYREPDWSLVYCDGESMIFVRRGFAQRELSKKKVYQEVLLEVQFWRRIYPWGPDYGESIEEALGELGR